MTRPREVYRCPDCSEMHSWLNDAQVCCAPDIDSEFECDVCEVTYYEFNEADLCCRDLAEC